MGDKLRLHQAVVVEGKYDKIKLDALVDAPILTTNGFGIFNNREQRELLRSLAATRGLVVLTDSDAAGFRIRGYLSGLVKKEQVIHVYIPDILGKERRKSRPSAEGKLGVEGVDLDTLRSAFENAGVLRDGEDAGPPITKLDLYEAGLCGGRGSQELRRALYRRLGLPSRLSANAALPLLNAMVGREEFLKLVQESGEDGEEASGRRK